jgi:hypothetical protein
VEEHWIALNLVHGLLGLGAAAAAVGRAARLRGVAVGRARLVLESAVAAHVLLVTMMGIFALFGLVALLRSAGEAGVSSATLFPDFGDFAGDDDDTWDHASTPNMSAFAAFVRQKPSRDLPVDYWIDRWFAAWTPVLVVVIVWLTFLLYKQRRSSSHMAMVLLGVVAGVAALGATSMATFGWFWFVFGIALLAGAAYMYMELRYHQFKADDLVAADKLRYDRVWAQLLHQAGRQDELRELSVAVSALLQPNAACLGQGQGQGQGQGAGVPPSGHDRRYRVCCVCCVAELTKVGRTFVRVLREAFGGCRPDANDVDLESSGTDTNAADFSAIQSNTSSASSDDADENSSLSHRLSAAASAAANLRAVRLWWGRPRQLVDDLAVLLAQAAVLNPHFQRVVSSWAAQFRLAGGAGDGQGVGSIVHACGVKRRVSGTVYFLTHTPYVCRVRTNGHFPTW